MKYHTIVEYTSSQFDTELERLQEQGFSPLYQPSVVALDESVNDSRVMFTALLCKPDPAPKQPGPDLHEIADMLNLFWRIGLSAKTEPGKPLEECDFVKECNEWVEKFKELTE